MGHDTRHAPVLQAINGFKTGNETKMHAVKHPKTVYPQTLLPCWIPTYTNKECLNTINGFLQPEKDTRTVQMRAVADPMQQMQKTGFATDLPLHEIIETECDQQAEGQNNVKLRIDRTTGLVADPSAQDHEGIEHQDCKRRGGMGASQADEHVVQVRLVGMKRGLALQDAGRHHTQRIEDRNRQHRQRKGHKPQILLGMHHVLGVVLQQPHDEYRHDDAHHERTAVPDEHLRCLAKDIVKEKRNERSCGYGCQNGHDRIVGQPEHHPELDARHDAVTRRKSVHAVDQVDGIDDAHGGKDRQRDGDFTGNLTESPQSVEIIQCVASDEDQQQDGANLHQKAQRRGEVEDVIERPGIEHDHHGDHHDEQIRTVAGNTGAPQSDHRSEKHGDTAKNGDRLALEFPGIGIIHDVFVKGNGDQSRMDPANAQNRNQRGDKIQHTWGYLFDGNNRKKRLQAENGQPVRQLPAQRLADTDSQCCGSEEADRPTYRPCPNQQS